MAVKGTTIVVNFATQGLQEARRYVTETAKHLRAAARQITDIRARKEALRQIKDQVFTARERISAEAARRKAQAEREAFEAAQAAAREAALQKQIEARERLAARAAAMRGRGSGAVGRITEGVQGALRGVGFARAVSGGSIGAFGALFGGGIGAALFAAADTIVQIVRPELEKVERRLEARIKGDLDARLAEISRKFDYERRTREDPEFARRESLRMRAQARGADVFRRTHVQRSPLEGHY